MNEDEDDAWKLDLPLEPLALGVASNARMVLEVALDARLRIPKPWLKLAAVLLREYSERLGNDGCNDWDWPDDWDDEERQAFILAHYRTNSGTTLEGGSELQELTDDLADLRSPSNFVVADVLADALEFGSR